MLLCKQPGDSGVFATATATQVAIYEVSEHVSLPDRPCCLHGACGGMNCKAGEPRGHVRQRDGEMGNTVLHHHEGGASTSFDDPSADFHVAQEDEPPLWGAPLRPTWVCRYRRPMARRAHAEEEGFRNGGFVAASSLLPPPLAPPLPTTLSLSCSTSQLHYFLGDGSGAGFIGCNRDPDLSAVGFTHSDGLAQGPSMRRIASGGDDRDSETLFGGTTPMPLEDGCAITASGWDPRNAAILALGRMDSVVQLLDVEYLVGGAGEPSPSGVPHIPATIGSFQTSASGEFHLGGAGGSRMQCSLIKHRRMRGPVTAIDWLPKSHLTVVGARRMDGLGYYAEMIDLRAPESVLSYLGAPPDAIGSSFNSSGSPLSLCYAEHLACDPHQRYVAAMGTHSGRDILQVWDIRMAARPIAQVHYPQVGYTSICWSLTEPLTLIGSTRTGELRVHSLEALVQVGKRDSDRPPAAPTHFRGHRPAAEGYPHPRGMGSSTNSLPPHGEGVGVPAVAGSTSSHEGSLPMVGVLPARVPVAAVLWVTRPSSKRDHGNAYATNIPVEQGYRSELPQLLLLNQRNGQIYTQVYNRRGAVVTMREDGVLAGAGPNLFGLVCPAAHPWTMEAYLGRTALGKALLYGLTDLLPLRGAEDRDTSPRRRHPASAVDAPPGEVPFEDFVEEDEEEEEDGALGDIFDRRSSGGPRMLPSGESAPTLDSGDDMVRGRSRGSFSDSREDPGAPFPEHHTGADAVLFEAIMRLPETERPLYSCLHGLRVPDRLSWASSRLRENFSTDPVHVLEVLLNEGRDKEAFCLFQYGLVATRAAFPAYALPPDSVVVPSLIDLLLAEVQRREQHGLTDTLLPDASVEDRKEDRPVAAKPSPQPPESAPFGHYSARSGATAGSRGGALGLGAVLRPALPLAGAGGRLPGEDVPKRPTFRVPLGDLRRLALEALGWQDGHASSLRGENSGFFVHGDGIGLSSQQEAVERRVAILTLLGKWREASEMLSSYSVHHDLYATIALELCAAQRAERWHVSQCAWQRTRGCTYWLTLALYHVDLSLTDRSRARRWSSSSPSTNGSSAERGPQPKARSASLSGHSPLGSSSSYSGIFRGAVEPSPQATTEWDHCLRLLHCFPQLPLSDKVALVVAMLLPAQYNAAHVWQTMDGLQYLITLQYPLDLSLSGGGPIASEDGHVPPPPPSSSCSLLLTAMVEPGGRDGASLQRYVDATADVQTPLCYVAAFGSTTTVTYACWRDTYRGRLNTSALYILRSTHDLQALKTEKRRCAIADELGGGVTSFDDRRQSSPTLPKGLETHYAVPRPFSFGPPRPSAVPDRQRVKESSASRLRSSARSVELRCRCGQAMHGTAPSKSAASQHSSTSQARRQLLPCGNPGCRQGQTPMCTVCGERMEHRSMELPPRRSFAWCTVCLHGGHWCHLRAWFAKHPKCPVEECPCRCYEHI